jgi:hypothetical protein
MVSRRALKEAVIPQSMPRIDASIPTSWHRETNLQPIVRDDSTVALPVMSSFQSDVVTLRMKWPLSWARRARMRSHSLVSRIPQITPEIFITPNRR